MSTQSIRFNGINRNVNQSDANIGDCEEMINVRSEGGILKIEKDKKLISLRNILYKRIITHQLSDTTNYIGFDDKGVVWFDPETGNIIKRLYDSSNGLNNIYIATNNNMVVISDKNNITTNSYIFSNNKYKRFISTEDLNISFNVSHNSYIVPGEIIHPIKAIAVPLHRDDNDEIDFLADEQYHLFQSAFNKFFEENKKYVCGYYLVGINITLWDGNETRLTNLQQFGPEDIFKQENTDNKYNLGLYEYTPSGSILELLSKGYVKWDIDKIANPHRIQIESIDLTQYEEYIKSINIYISRPISPIIFDKNNMQLKPEILADSSTFTLLPIEKSGLEKQLLYKYKSFSIQDLKKGVDEYIEFGLDELTTNQTLDIDTGLISRAGNMGIYNNRFHFFNTRAKVDLADGVSFNIKPLKVNSLDELDDPEKYEKIYYDMYIYLRDTNKNDIIYKVGNLFDYIKIGDPYIIHIEGMTIVQDSRAYQIVLAKDGGYAVIKLTSSPRYNYSYSYDAEWIFRDGDQYADVQPNDTYPEYNAINVTAQNNPIFFPVEHSYIFDGEIKDINYATDPISESQIGQYPLYVFTDRGIYSLEQGTGTVLYSNKLLINTDRILIPSSTCITRNGVAYIANNSVYILSGRHNLNISLDLKGPIDTDIRQNQSYDLCCANTKLYDISKYLSDETFEAYLEKAHLCYSSITDDLYVSNPDYPYSYVFSFIHKKWHKVSESYANINSTLIQRLVNITESTMIVATGSIEINSIIIKPEHTFNASYKFSITTDYKSGANERFALIIDGDEVATTNFKYETELHMIIANLCKDIDYLDEYYDGLTHNIYSTGSVNFKVVNLYTNRTIIDTDIDTPCNSVTIPDKGVNFMIGLQSCDYNTDNVMCFQEYTRAITAADTTDTIIGLLNDLISTYTKAYKFGGTLNNNQLLLTANSEGEQGNKIVTSYNSDDYIDIHIEQLSGGKGDLPGQYGQILDMSQPIDCERDIHIQSRPISWPNAYTQINRFILNCRAKLSEKHNLSVYIYASNDLIEWKLVQACQKSNVNIDHIRLNRAAKAYKHYIVIIGGKVYSDTELSAISLDINTKYNNKLR